MLLGWNRVEAMTWHTASVDSCWGPELSQSPVTQLCINVRMCAQLKKRYSGCAGACERVCVCVTVPEAQRNMAHRRAVTGREAAKAARPPSSRTQARRWRGLQAFPRVFCHRIHSFSCPSHLYRMGFRRPGFKRQHSNVLTDFSALAHPSSSYHPPPAGCQMQAKT